MRNGIGHSERRGGQRELTREELLRRAVGGAVLLSSGGLLASCGGGGGGGGGETAAKAKKGGMIRFGVSGGSSADKIDAHTPTTHADQSRVKQLYEALADRDTSFQVTMQLAEEITGEQPDLWVIRLKPDITFHNGKAVTAEDVVFSLRRIIDPKTASFGGSGLSSLDPQGIRKRDDLTVELKLKRPDVTIKDELANYFNGIVPVGYDPKNPVGTGAFKFQSFQPGQESLFVRNENYWREGEPIVDQVRIIDFADDTARVNALLGGQVDAIDQVPFGQIQVIKGDGKLKVLESPGGQWLPFTMRVDAEPFKDNRVRQAFRLIVDRQQMIDQALDGHGRVANDLYSPFDPCYIGEDVEQREQDLEQAKSLLQQAGQSNLTIELETGEVAAGVVEAAQVFAEQAKGAGVTVNVKKRDSSVFYGDNYLKWTFAQDFWGTRNYLQQAAAGSLPDSPYNETHWPVDKKYIDLVNEAKQTLDDAKRCEILGEAQMMEYEQGGHIIWAFANLNDAHRADLTGLVPDKGTLPLNQYGFRHAGFSS